MRLHLHAGTFLERHDRNIKRVMLRLKTYLADPDETNTHDLRTSIRRLEASHNVLPKALRSKPKEKKFVRSYVAFFKINGLVRDLDIMSARIARFDSHAVRLVLGELAQKRTETLASGDGLASRLERLQPPKFSPRMMSDMDLQRRFTKLVTPLLARIGEKLPTVLADEQEVEELHRLRIACKKLRYMMEISTGSDDLVRRLARMQDYLGSIHDSDILLDFLEGSMHAAGLRNVITAERRRRRRTFRALVASMR